jgi:hypothetical protein
VIWWELQSESIGDGGSYSGFSMNWPVSGSLWKDRPSLSVLLVGAQSYPTNPMVTTRRKKPYRPGVALTQPRPAQRQHVF